MNRVLRPLGVSAVIGMALGLALFFLATIALPGLSAPGTHQLNLGPIVWVEIVTEHSPEGGSFAARPGWGLIACWLLLLVRAVHVVLRSPRDRAHAPAGLIRS